jgi:glycerate-2-kinase
MTRLESEITEIKQMLNEFGFRGEKDRLTHLLEDDAENSDANSVDFIKQQKAMIKEQQDKLEKAKNQFKADKAGIEELRLSDPGLFRQKSEILAQVKEDLDRRIARLNEKVQKVKLME